MYTNCLTARIDMPQKTGDRGWWYCPGETIILCALTTERNEHIKILPGLCEGGLQLMNVPWFRRAVTNPRGFGLKSFKSEK